MQFFSGVGKGLKKFFAPKKESQTRVQEFIVAKEPKMPEPASLHGVSFGVVYANDLAKAEIEKDAPLFAVGSIIVREKNAAFNSQTPELVIAMVKREANFSPQTGDWEFFTFNGIDLKMKTRETTGSCATCHAEAKQTDFVFREYLK